MVTPIEPEGCINVWVFLFFSWAVKCVSSVQQKCQDTDHLGERLITCCQVSHTNTEMCHRTYTAIIEEETVMFLFWWFLWSRTHTRNTNWDAAPYLRQPFTSLFTSKEGCAATRVIFKTRAITWPNLCRVDLIPPPLSLATSAPPGDTITRDSRDRLGFKVTGGRSRPEEAKLTGRSGNVVGERTADS